MFIFAQIALSFLFIFAQVTHTFRFLQAWSPYQFHSFVYQVLPVFRVLTSPGNPQKAVAHVEGEDLFYPAVFLFVPAVVSEEAFDVRDGSVGRSFPGEMVENFGAEDSQVMDTMPVFCSQFEVYGIGFIPVEKVVCRGCVMVDKTAMSCIQEGAFLPFFEPLLIPFPGRTVKGHTIQDVPNFCKFPFFFVTVLCIPVEFTQDPGYILQFFIQVFFPFQVPGKGFSRDVLGYEHAVKMGVCCNRMRDVYYFFKSLEFVILVKHGFSGVVFFYFSGRFCKEFRNDTEAFSLKLIPADPVGRGPDPELPDSTVFIPYPVPLYTDQPVPEGISRFQLSYIFL